jgi:hypothetical protein
VCATKGYLKGAAKEVHWEEVEQRFVDAGWYLDSSFEGHLLIGHDGYRNSLLAHKEWWEADNPLFEILDHEQMITYWLDEVPTPQQASKLLEEHGKPPEDWDLP